jgi:hypothetical protein
MDFLEKANCWIIKREVSLEAIEPKLARTRPSRPPAADIRKKRGSGGIR